MKQLLKPVERKELPLVDSDLVKKAQNGDAKAFEELVRRYERKVYNIAYRILDRTDEVEEALQEIFLRVWRFLPKFKGESTFYTWLYRITTNVCLRRLRKLKRLKPVSLDETISTDDSEIIKEIADYSQSPEQIYHQQRLHEILQNAVQSLPPDYRTVVVLRDLEGLSTKEVSELLRLSVPAVKSRLHRGRMFLKNRLVKYL